MNTPGGRQNQDGFTLVELLVSIVVLGMVAISVLGLYATLVNSALAAKRKAVALTLATNQMEYLKSLPYNNLAVQGGSIYATTLLPSTTTQTINGVIYTVKTSINYVDDAYDGCASYPSATLKQKYCRNYPPPSGAPATDLNPADYKVIHVSVLAPATLKLAEVDTQVSARVAETASTTGALFVTVIDDSGSPISGATVQVVNSALVPSVNLSDSTDSNGNAIFYGLPPDTSGFNYVISASNSGYSSLSTIAPSGSLSPTYSSQKIITQLSSFVTLTIKPQGANSLLIETTNTSGSPLANAKIYVKGGYKKYTSSSDTSYYYDALSPSDVRPVSDSGGFATLSNLVPGQYIFCGDDGSMSCSIGGTPYYLAAALPYTGTNPFNPISVPIYSAASPPAITFPFNGNNFLQKIRLMLTTDSGFPRITSLTPDDVSLTGGTIANFAFQIKGANLPCDTNPSSCDTSVKFKQGATTYTANCSGTTGTQLDCTIDLTGVAVGDTQLVISANGRTLTTPGSPMLGGINVGP